SCAVHPPGRSADTQCHAPHRGRDCQPETRRCAQLRVFSARIGFPACSLGYAFDHRIARRRFTQTRSRRHVRGHPAPSPASPFQRCMIMDEIYVDADAVAHACASRLEQTIAQLQSTGATVRIDLTCGTIANRTYEMLGDDVAEASAAAFIWGEERFVDADRDCPYGNKARHTVISR